MNVPRSSQQFRIGVFGGAIMTGTAEIESLAKQIGQGIAQRGHVAITGATSGLPYLAGKAALGVGGTVLGISPARDANEHVKKYQKPLDGCSHIIYTGQGYTGRNYLNLRNCDIALFLGGEAGTLEEFCVGVYEGLVLGVFTNSGGICELLPEIVKRFATDHGQVFCFGVDVDQLINETIEAYHSKSSKTDWTIGG
jgi:uncharacterized protein (TIGR00725 family)